MNATKAINTINRIQDRYTNHLTYEHSNNKKTEELQDQGSLLQKMNKKRKKHSIVNKSARKDWNDSIAIKHSKYQTDILTAWMVEHIEKPYPDSSQLQELSLKTGLSTEQVRDWTTNQRKRSIKTVVSDGKEPRNFLQILALKQHYEKEHVSFARNASISGRVNHSNSIMENDDTARSSAFISTTGSGLLEEEVDQFQLDSFLNDDFNESDLWDSILTTNDIDAVVEEAAIAAANSSLELEPVSKDIFDEVPIDMGSNYDDNYSTSNRKKRKFSYESC